MNQPYGAAPESFAVLLAAEGYADYGLTRVTFAFEADCLTGVSLDVEVGTPERCKAESCTPQRDGRFELLRSRLEARYGPGECLDAICSWDERGVVLNKMFDWKVGLTYSVYSLSEWRRKLDAERKDLTNAKAKRSEL